jgi:hypothetical protein
LRQREPRRSSFFFSPGSRHGISGPWLPGISANGYSPAVLSMTAAQPSLRFDGGRTLSTPRRVACAGTRWGTVVLLASRWRQPYLRDLPSSPLPRAGQRTGQARWPLAQKVRISRTDLGSAPFLTPYRLDHACNLDKAAHQLRELPFHRHEFGSWRPTPPVAARHQSACRSSYPTLRAEGGGRSVPRDGGTRAFHPAPKARPVFPLGLGSRPQWEPGPLCASARLESKP